LGGSYFVEALTDEMERQAESYFAQIAEYGGVIEAIEAGFFQREIAEASYRYQRSIESKERIIVGVNQFTSGGEPPTDILKVNPELEEKQKRSVARVRGERDSAKAAEALKQVETAARDGSNVMPTIVDAVRSWCTLGEIADAMRQVFGEYQPVNTL
jgi:methylmalonyl-CoA mutase, N-terminal domain